MMRFIFIAAVAFAGFHLINSQGSPLKICAFNVQIFGKQKAENTDVMNILAKIFRKYDLCLIQEIRDTEDDSINSLLAAINGKKDDYRLILSNRLGRTNSKEQYGYFYNKNKLKVVDSFHFDDKAAGDLFEREPFIVRFKAPSAPVKDFFIVGIHTDPDKAVAEVSHLAQVYDDAVKRFGITDAVIMGDMNASCRYHAKKHFKTSLLRDERFLWLIGDDINTTVGKMNCAYDRIVAAGAKMQKHARDAQTYYYDEEMGIDLEMAEAVSDHYPVEFRIA